MDALTALLDGPHARGAFLLKAVFGGRWSLSIEDGAALSVVVVTHGSAVFSIDEGEHVARAGDVVIIRGPDPYRVADAAETPPDIRILPGQVCVDPHGSLLAESMSLGVRTWGNTRDPGATVMLIGAYEHETSVGSLLLSALPPIAVVRGGGGPLGAVLADEMTRDGPGQETMLDRLLDLIVVSALREVLPGAVTGDSDPVLGRALRLLQEHPDEPWTVRSLAAAVGLSRAALARRFTDGVGVPPLTYLTRWRLAMAADLLVGTDLTLATIASRVGYANPFALSAAFKREQGISPRAYRSGSSSARAATAT